MRHLAITSLTATTLLLSACDKLTPTAPATDLVAWDIDKPRSAEFEKAKLGTRTQKKWVALLKPPGTTKSVEFDLTVETAPFDLLTRQESHFLKAPVSVKITLKTNEQWVVTGKCDGEGAAMPTAPPPAPLTINCSVNLTGAKKEAYGTFFEVRGDGTIGTHGNFDTVVLLAEQK